MNNSRFRRILSNLLNGRPERLVTEEAIALNAAIEYAVSTPAARQAIAKRFGSVAVEAMDNLNRKDGEVSRG